MLSSILKGTNVIDGHALVVVVACTAPTTVPQLTRLDPLHGMFMSGATLCWQDSAVRKVADYGLALGIPIHSHIALNYVLTDYIPKASQGLLRLNMSGPGVTQTVKDLWGK